MAIKITFFCGPMTEMISRVVNMELLLLHRTVLTQILAFPSLNLYIFLPEVKVYMSPYLLGKLRAVHNLSSYFTLQIGKLFLSCTEYKSRNQTQSNHSFMPRLLYEVQQYLVPPRSHLVASYPPRSPELSCGS